MSVFSDMPVVSQDSAPGLVVEAKSLFKRYGASLAMDGIDLQVHPGEIYGLIGPDGAGKSSLLKSVAGVLAHDAGD